SVDELEAEMLQGQKLQDEELDEQ
ncbi:hypothetical protein Tco_0075949, partial [Tanacetum coccineum]